MAKISELTTLTTPITSSDLTMMIRPDGSGGYSSFKSPLDNFGKIRVIGSIGLTGSMLITGSGESLIVSGSGLFGSYMANAFYGSNKVAINSKMVNGLSRTELGNNYTLPFKSGLNIWSSGSATELSSGSTYMWHNIGQSKTPYGGVSQYGYVIRSQYQGTTVGSSSYLSIATASQALWVCRPTFNDQTDDYANSQWTDALDASHPNTQHSLVFRVITGSSIMASSLTIGVDDSSKSLGSFSSIGSAGAAGGLRMMSGSIYAPSSWGFKIGHLGGVSYTNHVRLGCDLAGDGYIAFGSSSNAMGMISTPSVSASLALVASSGDIVISTGIGGLFSGNRTIIYGSQSTTGSINSTGYINLPRGNSVSLGIGSAAELFTGSMAFNTSSMNMVVFTGNGSTTFAGSAGWKVVTLT